MAFDQRAQKRFCIYECRHFSEGGCPGPADESLPCVLDAVAVLEKNKDINKVRIGPGMSKCWMIRDENSSTGLSMFFEGGYW